MNEETEIGSRFTAHGSLQNELVESRHPKLVEGCNTVEGYTKFICNFTHTDCIKTNEIEELSFYRTKLFDIGLIGSFGNNISYGNISRRTNKNEFIISGTNTGKPKITNKEHYSKVTGWNISKNQIVCEGLIPASSETLSHAAIYEKLDNMNAVIHIHNKILWEKYFNVLPTTSEKASYGTVELALEIRKILADETVLKKGIIILGGHRDGILLFGQSLKEAYNNLISIYNENMTNNKRIVYEKN